MLHGTVSVMAKIIPMIKKILQEISVEIYKTEGAHMRFKKYAHMRTHEGWQVHQSLLISIANKLAETMLSEKFTKLDKEEKDANQRALYMTKEIIDFLLDPLKGAKNYAAITEWHKKLEATGRKRPKGA